MPKPSVMPTAWSGTSRTIWYFVQSVVPPAGRFPVLYDASVDPPPSARMKSTPPNPADFATSFVRSHALKRTRLPRHESARSACDTIRDAVVAGLSAAMCALEGPAVKYLAVRHYRVRVLLVDDRPGLERAPLGTRDEERGERQGEEDWRAHL